MKFLSVCSGIEAASVAWYPLGFKPVGFSEIEKFPCSVLSHRFPNVPNFGDMTRFEEWPIEPGSVDILVGGTPCQSFSIAGLRGGLTDGRGNLALVYCKILQRLRPRWFVWENVPGVLSSNGGRDFGSILGAMAELGYGFAWRVLDAQYFGVPQRRRRVFVVGHSGDWRRAAEVLFEPGCLCGDSQKGRKKRKDIAGTIASRTSAGGGLGTDFDLDGGIQVVGALACNTGPNGHDAGNFACNQSVDSGHVIPQKNGLGVRRLTPVECERLQGFPDNWTLVPHGPKQKPASDGPRYKAIGNSMAVPVMNWIGQRIRNDN